MVSNLEAYRVETPWYLLDICMRSDTIKLESPVTPGNCLDFRGLHSIPEMWVNFNTSVLDIYNMYLISLYIWCLYISVYEGSYMPKRTLALKCCFQGNYYHPELSWTAMSYL